MLKFLCPDLCLRSLVDVNLDRLQEQGSKGIILDIDNTVLPWAGEDIDASVILWVETAKSKGFRICLTSNALRQRAERIGDILAIPVIARAVKPRKKPFREALQILGTTATETVVIGDQLFTDVLGGNRMGLYTILLEPLAPKEMAATRVVRRVERRIIRHLSRKGYICETAARRRLAKGGTR
ncbi:MAG: YqeG family HAD IIIA-type phosphatase [Firmicutes bacterium]|nr:YqeG family HAD IIIA-type phosphatase [Bacillota bacterium]